MAKGGNGTRSNTPSNAAAGRTGRTDKGGIFSSAQAAGERVMAMTDSMSAYASQKGYRMYGGTMFIDIAGNAKQVKMVGVQATSSKTGDSYAVGYTTSIEQSTMSNNETVNMAKGAFGRTFSTLKEAIDFAKKEAKRINSI